jgi:CheY-like chemotaxis protein/anti-sigma regulatory factor (Ser/Thr protein kinase)
MATVLVVDDLMTHRALVAGLLARDPNWRVIFAPDGVQALDKLASEKVDLVLTDLLMPEMNGLELLRAAQRSHPHIPVVLMTASGSEEIAVKALEEGAASYVPKRALSRKLIKTLDSVMAANDERRLHSELARHLISQEFQFALSNNVPLVLGVPVYLKAHILASGRLDNLIRLRMHIVLEEALINALYHGNLQLGQEMRSKDATEFAKLVETRAREMPYSQRRIFVKARITPDEAVFVIRDEGPGFDPATLPDPADTAQLDLEHGRGITLMRSFMDEVHFNKVGNEVTMIKRSPPTVESATPAA